MRCSPGLDARSPRYKLETGGLEDRTSRYPDTNCHQYARSRLNAMPRLRLTSVAPIAGGTALLGAAGIATAAGAALWIQIVLGGLGILLAVASGWTGLREQSRSRRAMMRRSDAAIRTHFEPCARGVTHAGERGDYFVGRNVALQKLVSWVTADDHIGGIAIVTGGPGSGKSAVLGRLVMRSRGKLRSSSTPEARLPRRRLNAVVHARRLTLADVVASIAVAGDLEASTPEELIAEIGRRRSFVILIDSLDEAYGNQAWEIVDRLLVPLVGDTRARVLVGVRPGRDGEFLQALRPAGLEINLDEPEYFERDQVALYAERRLLATGDPDSHTPYRDRPQLTRQVSRRIAERAEHCFLVAHLVSSALALSSEPVDIRKSRWDEFPAEVNAAMKLYLDAIPDAQRKSARDMLAALAYSLGDGLPYADAAELWPRLAGAISEERYTHDHLRAVLDGPAGNLVEEVPSNGPRAYRLFHQALNEYLLALEQRGNPQRRILDALVDSITNTREPPDWTTASDYVRFHLAEHAALCHRAGALFSERSLAGYLTVGDPQALLRSLASLDATRGYGGSLVYRRVAHLLQMGDPQRNGRLLLYAAQRHDPQFFELLVSAIGAPAEDDAEFDDPLDGSEAGWVAENAMGVAACGVGSVPAVVILDHGGGVIVRRAVDGMELGRLPALPAESPLGAAIGSVDGEAVVVSSDVEGVIRARSLQSGRQVVQIASRTKGAPHVLTIIETIREPIIIYGIRHDLEVRHWPSGEEIEVDLSRLQAGARAVTAGIVNGCDTLLVSDGEGALHGRDLASGEAVPVPWRLDSDEVYALAFAPNDNDAVKLFSGDAHGIVCGWSASGRLAITYPGQTTPVVALYAGEVEGRSVLASASRGGRVVVWDVNSAETL